MPAAARVLAKADRTRAAVLDAAEDLFARRGYAATRLEDVAEAVGVKRAALFYHFRDKQALYDAALERAFGPLVERIEGVLRAVGPIASRIEAVVEVWVDALVARTALARLVLRHAAEAEERPEAPLFPAAERLLRLAWELFAEGRRTGELRPLHDDPFHAASALLGATVFYVSALPSLLPAADFDPLAPAEVAAHKRGVLRTARHLLGTGAPRSAGGRTR
jgi:TetR/AcrR family transcriptional regulator